MMMVGDPGNNEINLKNPLQQVFLNNMKQTLLSFEKYRDDL